jgi:hypothetical protein
MDNTIKYFTVIMPHGGDPNFTEKERIIEEIARPYFFSPIFPSFIEGTYFNIDEIIARFNRTAFIIVDLSYERPSCYYELGIAETLGSRVIIIALEGTDIHQTTHRCDVQYYKDINHYGKLLCEIYSDIRERLADGGILNSNQ